jgi:hypothetical protein
LKLKLQGTSNSNNNTNKRPDMKSTSTKLMLRNLLVPCVCAGLLAGATGIAGAANVLFNANLDDIGLNSQNNPSPNGWSIDASKSVSGAYFDGADSEPWCNVLDTGGSGLFFKPFAGAVDDTLSVRFYQDNPTTPGTKFTLSGYAAGEANYSGFFATNSPAPSTLFVIEFHDSSDAVLASNAFDLVAAGLPNTGPGSMSSFLYTTPQVTAPANTAKVRAGAYMLNTYNTTGGQSFFVDAFSLDSIAAAGSPDITNQPAQVSVGLGANASFTVGVSNPTGASYQWQLYGTNLLNGGNVAGALTKTLTITGVTAANVGHYRVLVSNGSGGNYSTDATLTIFAATFQPVMSITGKIGDTYRVDYATAVATNTWLPLTTVKLTTSPQQVLDPSYPADNARFYRAVFLH